MLDWGGGDDESHTPAALHPGNSAGTHSTDAVWVPQLVWTHAEDIPTGIRSPECLARRESHTDSAITAHAFN